MIGQTVSHYRILEELGRGGMGVVYIAEDTHLRRRVAIKFAPRAADDRRLHARLLREARAASRINHPHIAAVYDYGETPDGRPFIVMELVRGESLGGLLQGGALEVTRALGIALQIAEALGEAHRHGLVHRDIKPANVVITERGEVKVLDFGLAKEVKEVPPDADDPHALTLQATRTYDQALIGTPLYMSPEQARGEAADARSDLFSLGLLLYECLTGRPAFSGDNLAEVLAQVLGTDPPPPSRLNPRVPPGLDQITLKALAKQSAMRYQSAEELSADLRATRAAGTEADATLSHRTADVGQATLPARAPATLRRARRRPAALGALLLAALLSAPGRSHQPSAARAWYDRGTEALQEGAYDQASKLLGEAARLDPRFAPAHIRLAEAWAELDDPMRASDELLQAESLAREHGGLPDPEPLYLEAINAIVRREFGRAIQAYGQIARLRPGEAHAHADLGRAYEKNDESEKAVRSYEEAKRRSPQGALALLRLGALYGRRREFARARAEIDEAERRYQLLGSGEGLAEAFFQRGLLLKRQRDWEGAQREFAKVAAKDGSTLSQRIRAQLQLSDIAIKRGDFNQGKKLALEAVRLAQDRRLERGHADGLIGLGNACLGAGDGTEAARHFRSAMERARAAKESPTEMRATLALGGLQIQQGRLDEGLANVRTALEFFRQRDYREYEAQAQSMLWRASRKLGEYEAASRALEQLRQLAEKMGDQEMLALAHADMGNVFAEWEQYPQALARYDESYRLNRAQGAKSYAGYDAAARADALWQLGRYREARETLGEALSIAGREAGRDAQLLAWVHLLYARVALSEGRLAEARTSSQKAAALADVQTLEISVPATSTLGLAEVLSGRAGAGISLCEKAVAAAGGPGAGPPLLAAARLALAEALLESPDPRPALIAALGVQREFARLGRRDSEARAWLVASRASRRAGDPDRAREYRAEADGVLADLRGRWGEDHYRSYSSRPDLRRLLNGRR